mmetsp:Transcript_56671/g.90082  ORF Transcript_56671/g.90082 Transcript_56671/m.90082 type:complete len:222 (+) Transcript_56671:827-1492(+)
MLQSSLNPSIQRTPDKSFSDGLEVFCHALGTPGLARGRISPTCLEDCESVLQHRAKSHGDTHAVLTAWLFVPTRGFEQSGRNLGPKPPGHSARLAKMIRALACATLEIASPRNATASFSKRSTSSFCDGTPCIIRFVRLFPGHCCWIDCLSLPQRILEVAFSCRVALAIAPTIAVKLSTHSSRLCVSTAINALRKLHGPCFHKSGHADCEPLHAAYVKLGR